MKKRVKNGIEKHYCDLCGKNIFDEIPKDCDLKFAGITISEFNKKTRCDHKIVLKKGRCTEYCVECYKETQEGGGAR